MQIRKPIHKKEYDEDEDFDGNSIKKEILYQKVVLPVDGVDQVVKRRIHPQFFGFYENEEGKIEKYPVKYEFIEELSEHGNIHQINRSIELEFFEKIKVDTEVYAVEDNDGKIRRVNCPIEKDIFEYYELEDESGNKNIVKFKVEYEKVHKIIDQKDEIVKMIKPRHFFEYYEVENIDGSHSIKPIEFNREIRSIDGENAIVYAKVDHEEFEFVVVENIELQKKEIVHQKIEFERFRKKVEGKAQTVFRPFHPDQYEYDEIEDENGSKSLKKRKVEFEYVTIDDGKRVRRQIEPESYEYFEMDDQNGKKKLIKRKKLIQKSYEFREANC
ncbi:hypothetical protein M9Y10_045814 [Tritrichomonas musculus]|uniref:Uncharacterized protein n=1 Tax=Tritrichomonas musculus TaxID=1915356 RepID=A0ABR2JWA4_9EUKA